MQKTLEAIKYTIFLVLFGSAIGFIGMAIGIIGDEGVNAIKIASLKQEYETKIDILETKMYEKNETIFDFIWRENPSLTSREISQIIVSIYNLCDELQYDNPIRIFAIAAKESSYRVNALGPIGEHGLMQVRKSTFDLYKTKFHYTDENFNDWYCVLKVGISHWKACEDTYQNYEDALTAYNTGSNLTKERGYAMRVLTANRGLKKVRL